MQTVFISDLHLSPRRPELTKRFLGLLANLTPHNTDALYILGDLFELWLGDEDIQQHQTIIQAIQACPVPCYHLHGNRDFLLGQAFAKATHSQFLPEPHVFSLYGKCTVLMHGDALCTQDYAYQRFKKWVRHPYITKSYLALPYPIRQRLAAFCQKHSQRKNRQLYQTLPQHLDATPEAIQHTLTLHQAELLIHGHTHQPNIYPSRVVLGDWDNTLNVLIYPQDHQMQLIYV